MTEPNFPIYIGGNCHCGDGSKYDKMLPFKYRMDKVLEIAKTNTFIFNGDTVDCLEYKPEDVFQAWWYYIDKFRQNPNILFTDGNHEIYSELFADIFKGKYFQCIPVHNFDIQHGYLADPMFDTPNERKMIEQVALLYRTFKHLPGVTNFKEWISSLHHENEPFIKQFFDYHMKSGRNIIMSHTHTAVNFDNWFFATGPQLSIVVKIISPYKAELIEFDY